MGPGRAQDHRRHGRAGRPGPRPGRPQPRLDPGHRHGPWLHPGGRPAMAAGVPRTGTGGSSSLTGVQVGAVRRIAGTAGEVRCDVAAGAIVVADP